MDILLHHMAALPCAALRHKGLSPVPNIKLGSEKMILNNRGLLGPPASAWGRHMALRVFEKTTGAMWGSMDSTRALATWRYEPSEDVSNGEQMSVSACLVRPWGLNWLLKIHINDNANYG